MSFRGGYGKTTVNEFTATTLTPATGSTSLSSQQTTTKTVIYQTSLSLGFLYRSPDVEAGLLFTTSNISLEKLTYSYQYDDTTLTLAAPYSSGSQTTKNSMFMNGPPSILIGARFMTGNVDFIGEAAYLSTASQNINSLSYNSTSNSIIQSSTNSNNGLNAALRAGVIFHPWQNLRLIVGGTYIAEAVNTNSNSNSGNNSSNSSQQFDQLCILSGGIEYVLGPHVTFGIAGLYGMYFSSGTSQVSDSSFNINLNTKGNISVAKVWAGVSFAF
jgi:hypothetical protein